MLFQIWLPPANGPFSKHIWRNTLGPIHLEKPLWEAWGRRSPETSASLRGIKITKWRLKIQIDQVLTLPTGIWNSHLTAQVCPSLDQDLLRSEREGLQHSWWDPDRQGLWLQRVEGISAGGLSVFRNFSLVAVFPFTKKLTMNSHWGLVFKACLRTA